MITAHVPPFTVAHAEPAHPCAGCCQLAAVGGHGQPRAHNCRLHMSPFTRCLHYATDKPGDNIMHRLAGGQHTCR